ncbi:MAG: transcription antitermination factor NusB [Christensenellales bacterium]
MSRISARENLMQMIFAYNFDKDFEIEEDFFENKNLTSEDVEYIKNNFDGIKCHYDDIVKIIEDNLVNYKLDRICKTDLAILIASIYQIKYLNEPIKVVVNEAVDMSKKYSLDNSYKFVNGLLAKVANAV